MLKKRLLPIFVAIILLLSVMPVSFAATEAVFDTLDDDAFTAASIYDSYSVSKIAEETIAAKDYANGGTTSSGTPIVDAYTSATTTTGTGWKGNWLVKDSDDTDYRAPVADDKVLFFHLTYYTEGEILYLNKMPIGTNLYRFLNKSISFKDTYGKYVFSADIKNGNGYGYGKSHARFHIGDQIVVGYDKTVEDDKNDTRGTLVIEAGGKTYTYPDTIVLGPSSGSGHDNYYYRFEVEVSLIEDGEDIIKLTVTKRQKFNQVDSSAVPITIKMSAELDGSVDYLAFGSKKDSTTKTSLKLDNIGVSGISAAEIDALRHVAVKKGDFKSAEGIKLLDTSRITDSVVYDFELYNHYKTEKTAKAYLGVYYDNKLAGVRFISPTIPALSSSGNLTVGFADGLPTGDKSKMSVKVFIWEDDTLVPFCDAIDMYSPDDRAVTPEIFGANTNDAVTVAFMGDSITHGNPSYAKWIEYYYRIKYPTKDIKFVNKGISGDSSSGIEKRFEWDILNGYGTGTPTEVCLMIGMNDVDRDQYPDVGTDEAKQASIDACLENIEDITELCEQNNVKLTLITPPLYDEAAYSSVENYVGANGGLGKISEGIIKLANRKNLPYIDIYGNINNYDYAVRSNPEYAKKTIFNQRDRVHPTPAGTFAEGFIFITQQINDPIIASVDIDANTLVTTTDSATVTNVTYADNVLSYTYAPESLPMYMMEEYVLCNDTYGIPVTDNINREIIKVTGLAAGNYQIKFGDAIIGTYTEQQLAEGVNIATIETNPGYVQSMAVYEKVNSKMAQDSYLRGLAYVERNLVGKVNLEDVDACIGYVNEHYAESTSDYYTSYAERKKKQVATVAEIEKLEAEAKVAAQPQRYAVTITKQ